MTNNEFKSTLDPVAELMTDRSKARKMLDQNTDICFLATVDSQGNAHVRTLVVREIVGRTVAIFLNQGSPKWQQLQQGGQYELLLYYPTQERQYRLSGNYRDLDAALVADSWQLRPDGSKFLDYYYEQVAPQSTPVESREALLKNIEMLKQTLPEPEDLTAPVNARGLHLEINRIDRLDLTDPGRIHDRRLFTYVNGTWVVDVLVP